MVYGKQQAVTEPPAYLMPQMDDPLGLLGATSIISILDLHRVRGLKELIREVRLDSVFITPQSVYAFVFSLRIIRFTASFQSLVNKTSIRKKHEKIDGNLMENRITIVSIVTVCLTQFNEKLVRTK